MRRHLSARWRLTLLYVSLFALGGAALVSITYLLVANTLQSPPTIRTPRGVQQAVEGCLKAVQTGRAGPGAMTKCAAVYTRGVQVGASAQRSTTLAHLLTYSLLTLACVIVLAAVAGWIVAGRILRPVRRLTAAASEASQHNLSQRIALQGPRDELHELADTFDTMLERLDRAFTSQRQFIANASHELRTPLTLMRTAIDVVLAKPEPTRDELLSMAADVRHAVDHSERLIEVLLVLARNDQARTLTDPLDLAAVAEDALEGRAANGVTTITTLDEAPVTGDGMLLERLVANLLDNAERYNVAGGTVTISTTTEDGVSLVRVVNTGPVVPPGQVDRLFLPFTRLDDRTRHDGFGLGLALVSSIATVHGGTVHANANPGGGLDITVRLPRRYRGEWEVEVPLGGRCRAGPRTTGSSLLSGGLRGDPEPHQTKLIRIETAARPALAAAGAAFLRERLVPSWLAYLTLGGVPLGLLDALSFGGSPFEPIGLLGLFYFLFWSLATGTSLLFRPSVSMRPTEQPAVA